MAVRVVRIMPVLYSLLITSTARIDTTAGAASRRGDLRQPGAAYNDKATRKRRQRRAPSVPTKFSSPTGGPENRPTPAVPLDDLIRSADDVPDLGRERHEGVNSSMKATG
jgi:hypothetical protein